MERNSPFVFDQETIFMSPQLACAKIVPRSNVQRACLLHPIGNDTSDCREQVEGIPSRGEGQLRDVADHLPGRRGDFERMPAALAGAVKHELPRTRIKRDVNIQSGNRLFVSRTIRYCNSNVLPREGTVNGSAFGV